MPICLENKYCNIEYRMDNAKSKLRQKFSKTRKERSIRASKKSTKVNIDSARRKTKDKIDSARRKTKDKIDSARRKNREDPMEETIEAFKNLFTITIHASARRDSFAARPSFTIRYFNIPLSNQCPNTNFSSLLQDSIDNDGRSDMVDISSDRTLIVASMVDKITAQITGSCCDVISSRSVSIRPRANAYVCGFTTQISALIFLSIEDVIKTYPDWFKQPLSVGQIQRVIQSCISYISSRKHMYVSLQSELCPYADNTSNDLNPNNPLKLCNSRPLSFSQATITVGVPYIYTFFFNGGHHGNITAHHFCVFRSDHGEDCIISDSWTDAGRRSDWTRIVNINQFLSIMHFIDTTTDLVSQRTTINIFFHVPYQQASQYQTEQTELYRVFYYELTPERIRQIEGKAINLKGGS
jgi:hypothetical protein